MKQINRKKFISVSEYLARNIYQCYPNIRNISIVHPGIGEDFTKIEQKKLRHKLSIPSNSFLILLVANNFIKKGVPTSIKSIELLNNKNIHLILVGNGTISKKYIPESISNNIHLLGRITDMTSIYSEADLLIHPTLADTFGMAPLEAMSMNIPVILSSMKYCGFSEHLDDSEAIILNNPKDEVELAKQIDFLYKNADIRNNIAKQGNIKSKSINWENTLYKTQEIYDSIKF
jgi:UDP-glucose:(heptosyl)LPS alpha-1,3-glucosyltransferase